MEWLDQSPFLYQNDEMMMITIDPFSFLMIFVICDLFKSFMQVDVITGRQYSYAQLRDCTASFALRLQRTFKLQKGDVLAICLPNVPEYPGAILGAIEAGLTVTTVNPVYTAGKITTTPLSLPTHPSPYFMFRTNLLSQFSKLFSRYRFFFC